MGAAYHLEQMYEHIYNTRMQGIPIVNDSIKVQAVGFRAWNQHVLGVLITPWFMNLMLLPTEHTNWDGYKFGSKHSFAFEAGSFEFILGEEEGLGQYMSCSMFSPMFDFTSHDAAVETAEAIMTGIFKAENKEVLQGQDIAPEVEHDELGVVETVVEGAQAIGAITKEGLEKPLSRRELLRGGFLKRSNE